MAFYYIVDSKILKIHSEIFSISSLVKISITWSFPANNFVFKMATFVRAANQFASLLKAKNSMLLSQKWKYYKKTLKWCTGILWVQIIWCSMSEIKLNFSIIDQKWIFWPGFYTVYNYIIKRTLHGGLKIWILSSRGENNISLIRCAHSWNIVFTTRR